VPRASSAPGAKRDEPHADAWLGNQAVQQLLRVDAVRTSGGVADTTSGRALPESVRSEFERRLGADLRDVRIHTDAAAAGLARTARADAFTVGRSVVFGEGRFAPETEEGGRLVAHELAHVVQQRDRGEAAIDRKIERIDTSGCSVTIELEIGLYGSRATTALAALWQSWINSRWNGTVACTGNSAGTCAAGVNATVTAHPTLDWWWQLPESNSVYIREAGYRSYVNTLIDSGDWAVDEGQLTVAHETGHLLGLPDEYWNLSLLDYRSESDFVNDIMANYYSDPGPTVFGPALTRVLDAEDVLCPCCVRYPPCGPNNCALNPGLPCSAVGERRHCEWIHANNGPEALARYGIDCRTLPR